jgi:hypothetical protein
MKYFFASFLSINDLKFQKDAKGNIIVCLY